MTYDHLDSTEPQTCPQAMARVRELTRLAKPLMDAFTNLRPGSHRDAVYATLARLLARRTAIIEAWGLQEWAAGGAAE